MQATNSAIEGMQEQQRTQEMAIILAKKRRVAFIDRLNADMYAMDFDTPKDRSRYYSNAVVDYDKANHKLW